MMMRGLAKFELKTRLCRLHSPLSSPDLLFHYLQKLQDFIARPNHILLLVQKIFLHNLQTVVAKVLLPICL